MEMKSEIITITPLEAKAMLANNLGNRHVRNTLVQRYAADMAAGRWHPNSTIQVNVDGIVVDGQHRLLSCIEADAPFRAVVLTNVPDEAREALDVGLRRTLGDILKWKGETNVTSLAAAINTSWRWENGHLFDVRYPSIGESLAWFEANKGLRDALTRSYALYSPPLRFRASISAPFVYQATRLAPDDIDSFVDGLIGGAGLDESDARLVLRGWLLRAAAQPRKPYPTTMLAVTIKAWNAWIDGRPIKALVWRRGGANAEQMPEIIGPD